MGDIVPVCSFRDLQPTLTYYSLSQDQLLALVIANYSVVISVGISVVSHMDDQVVLLIDEIESQKKRLGNNTHKQTPLVPPQLDPRNDGNVRIQILTTQLEA